MNNIEDISIFFFSLLNDSLNSIVLYNFHKFHIHDFLKISYLDIAPRHW